MEAIIRLRLIGNGVPVFRLDHDVIFQEKNKDIDDLGLFKAIEWAVRAYQLRLAKPDVLTFLFSASYNASALGRSASGDGSVRGMEPGLCDWRLPSPGRGPPSDQSDLCPPSGRTEQGMGPIRQGAPGRDPGKAILRPDPGPIKLEPDGVEGLTSIVATPSTL